MGKDASLTNRGGQVVRKPWIWDAVADHTDAQAAASPEGLGQLLSRAMPGTGWH